jgi:hypothetical protein
MTMAANVLRTSTRIAWIALAIGAVVAGAIALTPSFDRAAFENQIAVRAQQRPPAPGSEQVLRRTIAELQHGRPDYARMSTGLAADVREQLPRSTRELAELGPPQTLRYLGGLGQADLYRATFRNGWRFWRIGLDADGRINALNFLKPGIPTPREYGENYASFPWRERALRMLSQIGVLLGTALFARLVLRLRL